MAFKSARVAGLVRKEAATAEWLSGNDGNRSEANDGVIGTGDKRVSHRHFATVRATRDHASEIQF